MPPPYRNPDYTPDNGQPYWRHYGPPNPNYNPQGPANMVPQGQTNMTTPSQANGMRQGQINMAHPPPGAHPRRIPRGSRASYTGNPRNAGIPSSSRTPVNSGFPINTGAPINTGMRNGPSVPQNNISGPNMPGFPDNTGVFTHGQAEPIQGQPIQGQPIQRQPNQGQPGASSQMSTHPGHHDGHSITNGQASTPANDDAIIQANGAGKQKFAIPHRKRYSEAVKNIAEFVEWEKDEKQARRREAGSDWSGDIPRNDPALARLVDRLGNAIANLAGTESKETRINPSKRGDDRLVDSASVKCVKDMDDRQIAGLAWKFLRAILAAQQGRLELHPKHNFTVYHKSMKRFKAVEHSLAFNKDCVRCAFDSDEWIDRIVADPEGERKRKKDNMGINAEKSKLLAEARRTRKNDSSTADSGKKRRASITTATNKRAKHVQSLSSDEEALEYQPQHQLDQPHGSQQYHGHHAPQAQVFQQPQPQELQQYQQAYTQHLQPQQPHQAEQYQQQFANHPQYEHPQRYGHPQQQFENHLQRENPQECVNTQQHGFALQHGGTQQLHNPQQFQDHLQIDVREQPEYPQGVNPQQLQYQPQYEGTQQVLNNQIEIPRQFEYPQQFGDLQQAQNYTQMENHEQFEQPQEGGHQAFGDYQQLQHSPEYENTRQVEDNEDETLQQSEHSQQSGIPQQLGNAQQTMYSQAPEQAQQHDITDAQQLSGFQQDETSEQLDQPQELGNPQQIENTQHLEHSQQHGSPPFQHSDTAQQPDNAQQPDSAQNFDDDRQLEIDQQRGSPEQQTQQPAAVPEATAAATPAADGPQSL